MKIISGGQTGADRTALEIAKELSFPTGGIAPKGYLTEVGPDLSLRDLFGLEESTSSQYAHRTRENVALGTITVWFGKTGSAGFMSTKKACRLERKPFIERPSEEELLDWIVHRNILILNCAGNRLSHNPSIIEEVRSVLYPVLATFREQVLLEALQRIERSSSTDSD
jgi:hypothetical protein